MTKTYYVYILTNFHHTALYVGMTNDLRRRVYEHKQRLVPGFTQKYHIDQLVYYEEVGDVYQAIQREKQLKAGPRQRKLDLIITTNPTWRDLWEEME